MDIDKKFAGNIPGIYDAYMVPLIFEPYAAEMARRAMTTSPKSVLEIAAGTGVVTRHLARSLPPMVSITASDLNPAMLEQAQKIGTSRPVQWKVADAMSLPFKDGSFDLVVCQFGAMFLPDKGKGFAEMRRVLQPGGTLLFNVWDAIKENEFADVIQHTLATLFPDDPPMFMSRTPHGYSDAATLERDLAAGGFTSRPSITTLAARSRAPSARHAAIAYCQGTPWRNEIELRKPGGIDEVTDAAAKDIAQHFGAGAVDGKIQAVIVAVKK